MRPQMIVMLAAGLGVLGWFWISALNKDTEKARAATPVRVCAPDIPAAERNACPDHEPVCLADTKFPQGMCTNRCEQPSHCRKKWCCAEVSGQHLCLPPETCGPAAPRNQ